MEKSTYVIYAGTMHYKPRVVDAEIGEGLATAGALVLRGARAVGKTESARQVAASELRLDSADPLAALARQQPSVVLAGDTPRLLDEWQVVPEIWNEVRHEVDARRAPGQFILSGSAVPQDEIRRHPGAGRFRQVNMRTMTFAETGHSSSQISLQALFKAQAIAPTASPLEFAAVVARIVTGGWPGWYEAQTSDAGTRSLSYLADITEHDFVQVAGTRRDPRRFLGYLRALAACTAQPSAFAALGRRMADEANVAVGEGAVPLLHDLAQRLYLSEDQPAWAPKLRSRTAAIQTPKRHLTDPSLGAALLGANVDRLLIEPETLGFLFESQVVHDLRVYAQAIGARGVFHYRDQRGRDEIDVVIEATDGSWLACEVKLGLGAVDAAAANLLRVTQTIQRQPAACVVVIPSGVAHRRDDGVYVVPIGVLGADLNDE